VNSIRLLELARSLLIAFSVGVRMIPAQHSPDERYEKSCSNLVKPHNILAHPL